MKVWKVIFHDPHAGTLISWWSNRRDAESELKWLKKQRGDEDGCGYDSLENKEIPTTKKELIAWLNDNLTTDNG